ncbi:hypothetical protein [Candidatus Pristimantibacillus sp. PTI5]
MLHALNKKPHLFDIISPEEVPYIMLDMDMQPLMQFKNYSPFNR